ncbi:TatD family like protein, partial [Aduncisulcus paluster]
MEGFKFIEIGGNLTDPVFVGSYRGKQAHPSDFEEMMKRADKVGVEKIIITVGSFEDFSDAVKLCKSYSGKLFMTCGIHPTRSLLITGKDDKPKQETIDTNIDKLRKLIVANREHIVAYGEMGLDFDRLHFAPKQAQLLAFDAQLKLAEELDLPLFLHSRAAESDFLRLLGKY